MTKESQESEQDRFTRILGATLSHTASEGLILARLEEFFSPAPARLADSSDDVEALNIRIQHVVEIYSGASHVIAQSVDTRGVQKLSAIGTLLELAG